MTRDHQLQHAVTAELCGAGRQLVGQIVVSVDAGDVRLSGEVNSFQGKLAAAALVTAMSGVRRVIDEMSVHPDMAGQQRLLLAARRVTGGAMAAGASMTDPDGAGIGISRDCGLLMITGELDWHQRLGTAHGASEHRPSKASGANIADDILGMLPRCFFSIPRAAR